MVLLTKGNFKPMNGIFLWGTDIKEMAEGIDPDQLNKMSLSWGLDFEAFSPWRPALPVTDGPKSRCWVSDKNSEQSLFVTGPCSSSMDLAWYFHQREMLPEWGSVLASSQWTGRGQLGREWFSPVGNIYGALRLPASALLHTDCLPLLMGYALIISLGLIGVEVKLKWPNDLVINNKKVGGILIEEKGGVTMVGVGINLASCPPNGLLSQHALPAACLQDFGYDLNPLSLWQHLVKTVHDNFNKIIITDLPEFMATLHSHLAFVGERVLVEDYANDSYEARILGLSSNGGLKLLTNCEIKVVRSASIYPLNV